MDKEKYYVDRNGLYEGKIPVRIFSNSDEVFIQIAREMVETIEANNQREEKTVFIVPVGPVGQYPYFVSMVNERNLSLKNVWLINMDEYLDENSNYISLDFPHSFRRFMDTHVYSLINRKLLMDESQRVFPDPAFPERIEDLIGELGKVDIAFGGIGINGHLAFNEAEDVDAIEFANRTTRVLDISLETITANGIADLDGALELMPKKAVTIGMKEILSAEKIRLGVFRPWHRAVVRRALFDTPSGSFPVTLVQNHKDALIYINDIASATPQR